MDLANLSSCKENYQELQEKDTQKISVGDEILSIKSDSVTVDMEPFTHLTNKDITLNSRINFQKSQSRKGSQIGAEKKMNCLMPDSDRDVIPSPKASLIVGTMPEKLMLVTGQTTDHITNPHVYHQITIMTGGATTTKTAGTPTKSRLLEKRLISFKQSSIIINPRRILFFFATLSSMGTILLICLTLSMAKYNEDDNSQVTNLT